MAVSVVKVSILELVVLKFDPVREMGVPSIWREKEHVPEPLPVAQAKRA